MVTILSGEDLERKGIHTVWQALGTVPGMEAERLKSEVLAVLLHLIKSLHSRDGKVLALVIKYNKKLTGLI